MSGKENKYVYIYIYMYLFMVVRKLGRNCSTYTVDLSNGAICCFMLFGEVIGCKVCFWGLRGCVATFLGI